MVGMGALFNKLLGLLSRFLFALCIESWENWQTQSKRYFLTGEGAVDPNDSNRASTLNQLAKTEISLSLTSKYELREGEDQDLKSLMIKYVLLKNLYFWQCFLFFVVLKVTSTVLSRLEHF